MLKNVLQKEKDSRDRKTDPPLHAELDEVAAGRFSWAPIRSYANRSGVCSSQALYSQPTTIHFLPKLGWSQDPALGVTKAKRLQARWVPVVAWGAQRPSTCEEHACAQVLKKTPCPRLNRKLSCSSCSLTR